MKRTKKLEEVFPIWKVEDDYIISKGGSVTIAFEVSLPEIFTLSTQDYEAIHAALIKAVRVLPAQTVLHKQDWFFEAKYEADLSANISFLSRGSDRHFNERPYLDHSCYLYVSTVPANLKAPGPLSSTLIRSAALAQTVAEEKQVNLFTDKVGQFASILQDCGYLTLRRLKTAELVSSDAKAGLLERYCLLLGKEEYPTLADFHTGRELKIGDRPIHLFSLAEAESLPALCGPRATYDKYSTEQSKFSVCFAAPLGLLLNCNHIYNQYIVIGESGANMMKLERKRKRLQSLSAYSRENAIGRDATNAFLNEAVSQNRLPIQASFNVIAWSDDPARSREIKNIVSAGMAAIDAKAKLETAAAATLFWSAIPGNAAQLPITSRFDTFAEQASCFFNIETNYHSSLCASGIRFGDRLTGMPVQVDLFDLPYQQNIINNRNIFLCGPSGSGKSFATNHILRSCSEAGAHVLVVDVGHSYRGLCDLAKGYYFTFSETNPIRFNPFYIPDLRLDTEKRESIKALLLALWKKDDEAFTRSEYVSLSNALQGYYDYLRVRDDIVACFNTFYEYLQGVFMPELRQQGIKEKDFDIDNFLYVLKPYYTGGEYDYLLNATENLDMLGTDFIVFELDNIKDHPILFPVVTLIIMEVFINKMRRLRGVRKIILIEEAWKAIAKAGMAEYIKYLFKTVRKFFGTAAVVTQEINDIISNPIIKDTIIANSDIKILLDQSKYQNKFQAIQDMLGLTEKDKTLILSMNKANDPSLKYKEIFIGLGSHSKVYRTEVSLEEYLCYTTEEKEKVLVQEYGQRFGSLKRGIAMLANDIRVKAVS